jgi:hypothetical protein
MCLPNLFNLSKWEGSIMVGRLETFEISEALMGLNWPLYFDGLG